MLRNLSVSCLLIGALFTGALAQKQPSARPQTPRQALIEIVTKGGDSVLKHLTVEVQEMFLKPENKFGGPMLTAIAGMKPDAGLQAFEAGDILFTYTEPRQHMKYEVRVDNDDMAGTEDTLLLSIHAVKDGKEEDPGFGFMSTHFSVNMKQQQNIWRLNKISVGADFPIGDPEFVKQTFMKGKLTGASDIHVAGDRRADSSAETAQPANMPPHQVLMLLGLAETTFARQHPETGFTCSLTELSEDSKMMGIDGQVNTGTYYGYRFSLSGCEGKPAGSYQLLAEPLSHGKGSKTYCSDATQNVRELESGGSCFAFGKVVQSGADEGSTGFVFATTEAKPSPEDKR
jgi:hypothetical protein